MTIDQTPTRVRTAYAAQVAAKVSDKDVAILETVNRLHLLSGWQIDRLFFDHLTGHSRTVTRSRALKRLTDWRVLQRLPRRIGGGKRGSSVAVYALDSAGQILLAWRNHGIGGPVHVRKPTPPSDRFVAHILTTTELYVSLTEQERSGLLELRHFVTEPASWWPNSPNGYLKPDAFFVVSDGNVDYLWWLETDMATESVTTVVSKLKAYLDFFRRGQLGPQETMPRVLVSVPNDVRQANLLRAIARLPEPASELFAVVEHTAAASWVADALRE
jgi:hypothetical protein